MDALSVVQSKFVQAIENKFVVLKSNISFGHTAIFSMHVCVYISIDCTVKNVRDRNEKWGKKTKINRTLHSGTGYSELVLNPLIVTPRKRRYGRSTLNRLMSIFNNVCPSVWPYIFSLGMKAYNIHYKKMCSILKKRP